MTMQEIESLDRIDETIIEKIRSKYERYYYFNIDLIANGRDVMSNVNIQDHQRVFQGIVFNLQNSIEIRTSNNDTINATDYISPQMYGNTNKTSLLFAFEREKINKNNPGTINLVAKELLEDKKELVFEFASNDIKSVPSLNLQIK